MDNIPPIFSNIPCSLILKSLLYFYDLQSIAMLLYIPIYELSNRKKQGKLPVYSSLDFDASASNSLVPVSPKKMRRSA